jgi:hypothetical protein
MNQGVILMKCSHCTYEIPASRDCCPHCGLPALFPNVRAAEEPSEAAALEVRYKHAITAATARGDEVVVRQFEAAVAGSKAVVNRPFSKVEEWASSDKQLYATYFQQLDAGVRLPDDDKWHHLRAMARPALFPDYGTKVQFGALSLDGVGSRQFGDCAVTLREEMICHRASVFEGNTAAIMRKCDYNFVSVLGFRAPWDSRARLAVAKLAGEVASSTKQSEFPRILLRPAPKSEDDEFVEVHIYGSMTRRTFERVVINSASKHSRTRVKALGVVLAGVGVNLDVL